MTQGAQENYFGIGQENKKKSTYKNIYVPYLAILVGDFLGIIGVIFWVIVLEFIGFI